MLVELLDILQHSQSGLSLTELSRRLGVDTGVTSGMLQLLVSKGRIVEVGHAACTACPLQSGCNIISGQNCRYMLLSRNAGSRQNSETPSPVANPCCR